MKPDSIDRTERVKHGGTTNTELLEFSANTNPETPDGVDEVYRSALSAARRYPDDSYPAFRAAASDVVNCDPSQIVPTAGGLEAIRLAIGTQVDAGDRVLVPAPSFSEYAREVQLQGATPEFLPAVELLDADPRGVSMVVVCNPNNPTGRAYDHEALREFATVCRRAGTTLLVDEAFLNFTDRPSMAGIEGVIVARSLTKLYGLPGLRAGYAVGTGQELGRLETARRAWSMSTPAAMVGAHSLRSTSFAERTRQRVESERERMRRSLSERFTVFPSSAPFLLLDVGDRSVDGIVDHCESAGIAVRDARSFRTLDSHIRVAVRLPAENDRLLEVLSDV